MSKFKLSKGIKEEPEFMVVYGVEGVGKTTFAAESPNNIVVDVEGGSSQVDVYNRIESTEIKDFDSVLEAMKFAASDESCQGITVDSLSKVEELLWKKTCKRKSVNGKTFKSIEDFGYKQGYIFALDEWMEFINVCKGIKASGKRVILVGHERAKNFDDPTLLEAYARYEIDIHPKASALIRRYVDAIVFANYKTLVKDGKGLETGERCLYTERRPGHDAKNRYCLPYELPLSWSEFQSAKVNSKEDPEVYKRQIEEMVTDIPNDETRGKILEAIKVDLSIPQLKAYVERVETLIGATEC